MFQGFVSKPIQADYLTFAVSLYFDFTPMNTNTSFLLWTKYLGDCEVQMFFNTKYRNIVTNRIKRPCKKKCCQ